ncbi:porin [Rhodoferax sp.]|uniref:porin n=1 Tax=Rhodoferax sp. TaxID=50421 RepID=UPI0025DC6D3A|nr:porin [Rhodoferax sp.]
MSIHIPKSKQWAASTIAAASVLAFATNAAAQTSVQLYGLVGTYVASIKRSDTVVRNSVVGSGGLTTSYFGLRGKDDLGGGLASVFQLENFFQPDTGGAGRSAKDPTAFSRSAWVGLQGDLGSLTLGRHTSPYYVAMQAVNPFQSSVVFSPLVLQSYVATFGGTLIGDTVWDNAVQYLSPKVGGVTGMVIYGVGEVLGNTAVNNAGLSLNYTSGLLVAVLSAQNVRTAAVTPSTGQRAYQAGFSYDFGKAKLYGSAQGTDNAVTDIKTHTYQVGTSIPVTAAGAVLVSWAHTSTDNPKAASVNRNTAALGYDHFLSVRTDVYATYLYDKTSNQAVGNSVGLGIRHRF